MTRDEKKEILDELNGKFSQYNYFYITDASGMTVEQVNKFRRLCYDRGLEYKVYKNSLIKKALAETGTDYSEFNPVLKGFSGVLFSSQSGKEPAKLLKEFYKTGSTKPLFKGASVDSALFVGEKQLDTLLTIKSKQELVGDIIGLLQSPAKNVISGLTSGGGKLAGILKTLSERNS